LIPSVVVGERDGVAGATATPPGRRLTTVVLVDLTELVDDTIATAVCDRLVLDIETPDLPPLASGVVGPAEVIEVSAGQAPLPVVDEGERERDGARVIRQAGRPTAQVARHRDVERETGLTARDERHRRPIDVGVGLQRADVIGHLAELLVRAVLIARDGRVRPRHRRVRRSLGGRTTPALLRPEDHQGEEGQQDPVKDRIPHLAILHALSRVVSHHPGESAPPQENYHNCDNSLLEGTKLIMVTKS